MKVYLRIQSFATVGGSHLYGVLEDEDHKRHEVTKNLSKLEASRLNRLDGWRTYHEGDLSSRFMDLDRLRTMAIEQYEENWPKAQCLIEGYPYIRNSQPVLAGKLREIAN